MKIKKIEVDISGQIQQLKINPLIRNKEKTAVIKRGFDEISNLSDKILCSNYAKRLFKSFGLRSWVGEIGSRTGLISQRSGQDLVGSNFLTEVPHPAHKSK